MGIIDFNNDLAINFREYIVAAGLVANPEATNQLALNCSTCVGVENYNPVSVD